MTEWPSLAPLRQHVLYLTGLLLFAVALGLAPLLGDPLRWTGLLFFLPGVWCVLRLRRDLLRERIRKIIGTRLSRLPQDFVVLRSLVVPAPWGHSYVDYLILSRFGLVVVTAGPSSAWMMEPVEALRSLLVSQGLAQASVPIRPLVLLPPGATDATLPDNGTPVVRIEQVRLSHLAPSTGSIIPDDQLHSIRRHLQLLQHVA